MLFRFREFPVYIKAKEFRKLVKKLLKKFPSSEHFVLIDQIDRAVNSICLNIAEGSNRVSDKDKAHFLNQALTSLEEVIAGFDLALDDGYITKDEMGNLIKMGEDIGRQLIGFSKTLRSS
ncbi:four helix bundle protein [Candidatus Roizmanbacteria bacterium]|nr:four helix bundle protein [Candidatus Roizmanbacteria bacterium]